MRALYTGGERDSMYIKDERGLDGSGANGEMDETLNPKPLPKVFCADRVTAPTGFSAATPADLNTLRADDPIDPIDAASTT